MVHTANNSQTPEIAKWTDTLGQTAMNGSLAGGGTGTTGSGGFGPGPDIFSYTDINGDTKKYTVAYTGYSLRSNFSCSGISDPNDGTTLTTYLPVSVTFPDYSVLGISYEPTPGGNSSNVTGRIAKLTLPSGGSITYAYSGGNNGINCSSGVVPTLTRTVNDNNGNVSISTYVNSNSSTTSSNYTVTATDPAGNKTVYTFTGDNQTEMQVYQGAISPGNLLATTVTCYNGNFANCPSLSTPPTSISQTDVFTYPTGSTSAALLETKFNTNYGTVTEVKRYDFGAATSLPPTAAPGSSPVSDTTTTYAGVNGVACGTVASSQYDRPCSITTLNSSGSTVSQVKYTYTNGHPTQTSVLVSGSTYLTSSASYNTNGTIASSTNANGAISTYAYNGTNGCNSLLPTSVTVKGAGLPSAGLTSSTQWNCDGGVGTQLTDPNQQPTNYTYNDPLWRITSTKDPLGEATTYTYPSPTSFNTSASFGSSIQNTTITADGLGRTINVQTQQGPGATTYDTVSTSYAWGGGGNNHRVITTNVPCAAGLNAACGGTNQIFTDALGRTTWSSTPATGEYVQTLHNQNDVLSSLNPPPAGENAKSTQKEYDGLGRLTSVCELTSVPGRGVCGQSNPATGFLTKYTYDALGHLLTVTQNAQPGAIGGVQTRSYAYDGLAGC